MFNISDPRARRLLHPDGEYVAVKRILVDGVQLEPGDSVPADAKIRRIPGKIGNLCQQRYIRPVIKVKVKKSVEEGSKVSSTTVEPKPKPRIPKPRPAIDTGYSRMTIWELRKEATKRGLSGGGTKKEILKRLQAAS